MEPTEVAIFLFHHFLLTLQTVVSRHWLMQTILHLRYPSLHSVSVALNLESKQKTNQNTFTN